MGRKTVLAATLLAIAPYAAAYLGARASRVLVHRTGYRTNGAGVAVVDGHRVTVGDHGPFGSPAGPLACTFFAPLRAAEAYVWYAWRPAGSRF